MTILVLSDIHANLEALDAVLTHVRGFDSMWFLGDAVGYGPDPNACVERLVDLDPAVWLAGNHDAAALGDIDTSEFNPDAHRSAEWTRDELRDDLLARLQSLPARIDLPEQRLTFVHGSPRRPIWEYILNASTALDNFEHFEAPLCFFGHTHVPVVYEEGLDGALRLSLELEVARSQGDARWLANPGSVGQPRDGDPRASYLLYDPLDRTVTFHRVGYDIGAVQDKILSAGLPTSLAARLDYGW